ncbi:hypothetical protein NSTC745_02357 [Nostoc sp. DSM 114161]|jgi:colanic acid/amylovoran biosynthesis glycosyltransferase|uniref:glycosyltransferase n=1 Tax=Nostoc sp. DSM 114161 TaxID=3440143 RepID=UPI0040454691
MHIRKQILLITNSYPAKGSTEKVFILPELRYLVNAGFQVTIMPVRKFSTIDSDIPKEVVISDELANAYSVGNVGICSLNLLKNPQFWGELLKRPSLLFRKKFWKDSIRAEVSANMFSSKLCEFDLFYTYWFAGETIGLAWARAKLIVTRAHGYDIYLEREQNRGWIPYRHNLVRLVDKIVVLSNSAGDYLMAHYETEPSRIAVHKLGVESHTPAPFNASGHKSEISFLSCSYARKVKRLPLIAKFISMFAAINPDLSVSWTHIGAAKDELGIESDLDSVPNLTVKALGRQPNEFVMSFLQTNEVSFFINLSASEGQPVSIMEAMSFGVPIIATAVGAVPEMLIDGGGILLEKDFDVAIAVNKIAEIFRKPETYYSLRQEAISIQRNFFDSCKNHQQFAKFLTELIE